MTVLLYADWSTATGNPPWNSTGTATLASPSIPVGKVFDTNWASFYTWPNDGSAWANQIVFNLQNAWFSTAITSLSSSTWNHSAGRMLFEFKDATGDGNGGGTELIEAHATTVNNGRFRFYRTYGNSGTTPSSSGNQYVAIDWNGPSRYEVNWADSTNDTITTVEFAYDLNHGTANQRLRARKWNTGASPGSMLNADYTDGPAGNADQATELVLGNGNGTNTLWFRKIIISDDPSEDLSSWTPPSGSLFPFGAFRALPSGILVR